MEPISKEFIDLNIQRSIQVFNQWPTWSNSTHFLTGMLEELGEISGALKKLNRGFTPMDLDKMRSRPTSEHFTDAELKRQWEYEKHQDLAKEVADIIIYAILFARSQDVDINTVLVEKFNEVSRKMQAPDEFIIPE